MSSGLPNHTWPGEGKGKSGADYTEAISRGETAGLLEQLPESSDVFTTRIGNIPATEQIVVEITYLGELKHDAEVDGVRFTIPTAIAPRYGTVSNSQAGLPADSHHATDKGGIRITVDISVDEGSFIKGIQSPSHPIAVTFSRTSIMAENSTDPHRASATLSLGSTQLEKDFVLLVLAKDRDIPRALFETHPKFPNQRALLATRVPRFNLPPSRPEIVFVVDRSGSMQGKKILTVVSAIRVLLKSLPVGVKFNICSFGSHFSFLWPRSKSYDRSSLEAALAHMSTFAADFGGTEMFQPIVDTVKNRYKDMELELMLLTDGQIWNQQQLFDFINEIVAKEPVRFFSLGVGAAASHSLVEGIARAGNGFAQSVGENEQLDKRVVRMLKGALTPHIKDYTLEVKYEQSSPEDYELVERVTDGLRVLVTDPHSKKGEDTPEKPTISLFDPSIKSEDEKKPSSDQSGQGQDRYSHLPKVAPPKLLQAPSHIPSLYSFIRTSVYLLMSLEACQNTPKSVVLRATSEHGPLELEIPVQDIGKGQTIHQLAAKKAVTELEEGRGWIVDASGADGKQLKDQLDGRWDEVVERDAVHLGVKFQVSGKWCSFVAVQKKTAQVDQEDADMMSRAHDEFDYEIVDLGDASALDFDTYQAPPVPQLQPRPRRFGLRSPGPQIQPGSTLSTSARWPRKNKVARRTSNAYGHADAGELPCSYDSVEPDPSAIAFLSADSHSHSVSASRVREAGPNAFALHSDASQAEGWKPRQLETPEDQMHALVALQTFDGSWEWTDELLRVLGLKTEDVASLQGETDTMATVLAIAFLEREVPGQKATWELVVEKARSWLEIRGVGDVEVEVQRVATLFGKGGK